MFHLPGFYRNAPNELRTRQNSRCALCIVGTPNSMSRNSFILLVSAFFYFVIT
jgi:hypothetical protein